MITEDIILILVLVTRTLELVIEILKLYKGHEEKR